jgi:hypothetical protein
LGEPSLWNQAQLMPPLALALVFITLPFHRGAHYHGAFH